MLRLWRRVKQNPPWGHQTVKKQQGGVMEVVALAQDPVIVIFVEISAEDDDI